jgi:hypothetical protein
MRRIHQDTDSSGFEDSKKGYNGEMGLLQTYNDRGLRFLHLIIQMQQLFA